jgi:hypothetical protein
MDKKEFIVRVQNAGRELSPGAIKVAIEYFLDENAEPFRNVQTRQAVELAGRIAAVIAGEKSSNGKDSLNLMLGESITGSDVLCDFLEPWIAEIRHEIFGSAGLPFSSDIAAIEWIEAQRPPSTKKHWSVSEGLKEAQKSADAQRTFLALKKRIEALTGYEVKYSYYLYSYPAFLQNGTMLQVPIQPGVGDKLHILTRACKNMAENHGFNAALLSWWILRGMRPIQPRVVVTRIARPLGPPATNITINGVPNLTWRETLDAFKQIQKFTGISKRPQKLYQYRIKQIVKNRGGIPNHGSKTQFWESIRKFIQKKYGNAPRTWQAIRKAYFAKE